jgi:uncharacterized protein
LPPLTERFELRLDEETIARIDRWRSQQASPPSRADAVRSLISIALSPSPNESVETSDAEKLIISMLSEIHKATVKGKAEIDPDFVMSAIFHGHTWGLKWEYTGLFDAQEVSYARVKHVVDALDMWTFIESAVAKLTPKQRAELEKAATLYGKHPTFNGYDGNHETQYMGIARFLVQDMDRFATFKGRGFNSHVPSVARYSRMITKFEPMRVNLGGGKELSIAQLADLLSVDR